MKNHRQIFCAVTISFLAVFVKAECSPEQQSELAVAVRQAGELSSTLAESKEKVFQNLQRHFGVKVNELTQTGFNHMVNCIQGKFQKERFSVVCNSASGIDAQTGVPSCMQGSSRGYAGSVVRKDVIASHFKGRGQVNVCETVLADTMNQFLVTMLVREVSRLCLAQEYSYFEGLSHENMRKVNWVMNADSYRNIVNNLNELLK